MSGHPSRETLQGFLLSLLSPSEAQATASHLLKGCQQCREEIAMLSSSLFSDYDEDLEPEELTDDLEEAYDRAITLAMSSAMRTVHELAVQKEEAEAALDRLVAAATSGHEIHYDGEFSVGFCESLIDRSFDLRESDPRATLRLARLAQEGVERLVPGSYPTGLLFDLRARAWANLANSLRLNEELPQAQSAMRKASELRSQGTGDPLLEARLADLGASLAYTLRQFGEALHLLDVALAIHRAHSSPHEIGRLLVLKGLYTGASGDSATGLQLLAQSLKLIDRSRNPRLAFQALHNILYLRTELGEFEAAERQLRKMQPLYDQFAPPFLRLKLLGLEGEIAAGLGDLKGAEAKLREAQAAFDEAEMGYMASLISLSLAIVLLRQGRTIEVRELVLNVVASYQALGVDREAMAAVQVLREAQEHDQATVEVLRLAGRILRRLQRDPAARVVDLL